MHPNTHRTQRRVHGAEIKAKVLAQCREPEASAASVALANGLNANLVRKWLTGRGLKRSGLTIDGVLPLTSVAPMRRPPVRAKQVASAAAGLQFVPVGLHAASHCDDLAAGGASRAVPVDAAHIHVELRGPSACLAVHWPASQAHMCASWLSELAGAVLK
jgi:transposase